MTQPIHDTDHITISRDKLENIHLVKPLKLKMKENGLLYRLRMMIEESIWWWWYHMTIALIPKSITVESKVWAKTEWNAV